jgi:hypothetical protein
MEEAVTSNGYTPGGNVNERLEVISGSVVVIDHFMPACPSFRKAITERGLTCAVVEFGGIQAPLVNGSYSVLRNPYSKQMLVCPLGSAGEDFTLSTDKYEPLGSVYVDTRCLIILDTQILGDPALLDQYRELWIDGSEGQKRARDLIRSKGGAVRYGFSRGSDVITAASDSERLALWVEEGEDFADDPAA